MKAQPYISIITPTLNSESTIEACLKSVAEQTYTNIEHLIIDGLSTDRTLEIVTNFQTKYNHIRLLSEKDSGIYDAMNKGVEIASGELLYFLGSDDVLYNNSILERVIISKKIKYQIIYGNVEFKHSKRIYDYKFNWFKILKRNICHQAIFFRKEVFNQIGAFHVKYKMLADWEFNIRWINNDTIQKAYVDSIISIYNEDGLSFNNPDLAFGEDFCDIIKTNLPFIKQKLWHYRNTIMLRKILSTLYL